MDIAYTTNDVFCAKVGESICSVFENNENMDDIHVYVIGQGITEKNQKKFLGLAERYHREITIVPINDLKEYIPFDFDTFGWNPIVLARLVIDKLVPDSIDRILYLDGDTCCIDNLTELWNTDLKGNVIGGCMEPTVQKERYHEIHTEGIPYINAGVLLIDLKKWRAEKWGEKILDFYREYNGRLFANDQDAINGALHGRIYYLAPKYNFFNIYWFYPYRYLKHLNESRGLYYYPKDVYEDSIRHPAIIHFLGEERPWRKGNHQKFRKQYRYYLNKTEWKDDPDEEGWKTYYICWDIFNFLTHPFPAVRYNIITGLIPEMMKMRKNKRLREKSDS